MFHLVAGIFHHAMVRRFSFYVLHREPDLQCLLSVVMMPSPSTVHGGHPGVPFRLPEPAAVEHLVDRRHRRSCTACVSVF
jgi:hypothetical protein